MNGAVRRTCLTKMIYMIDMPAKIGCRVLVILYETQLPQTINMIDI